MNPESCGPVTQKTTHPDGTVNEMTFACPNDAATFNERISMNVTVPKQTQNATFGEKTIQNTPLDTTSISTLMRGKLKGKIMINLNRKQVLKAFYKSV